ncbi:MAG: 3-deoxy-D-manno-octulosonic acid transferase [Bauldia sp.]
MADRRSSLLLAGYRLAGALMTPFAPVLLARRAARGKEDRDRLKERQGIASGPRPAGPLVWVHAASVGETNAVLPLLTALLDRGLSVLLTTVTVTGAAVASLRLPKGALHQFAPLDLPAYVARFLAHWRPALALFVESEIWPATVSALGDRGIPLALVNARMSPRSYGRWLRLRGPGREIFGRIALCLAQSTDDAGRLGELGARDSRAVGNLKFDVPPPAVDASVFAALEQAVRGRPVFVAASTHSGEESVVVAAAQVLRTTAPELLTVIVPRHPTRGPEVASTVTSAGMRPALRSAGALPSTDTDVYIADTVGELGLFYRLSPFAFVGGSLVPRGGQNPIEPVRLGAAVLHGPHVVNFTDVYRTLDNGGGAAAVADAPSLAEAARRWLTRPGDAKKAASAGAAALAPYVGALERTLAALDPLLHAALGTGPRLPDCA